jgi:transcriptional regulator GlxA family with amidase domain
VTAASVGGRPIEADGLTFAGLVPLADVPGCDLVCVPGGFGVAEAMHDPDFMRDLRRLAAGARYVTSVCTGSLVLAAAGLLRGRRAASHWAWRDLLALFPEVTVDPGRVVRDGNVITGGGVTAGIDFALTVAAEVAGPEVAQAIQLGLEYAPEPPFRGGRPELAPPEVLDRVNRSNAKVKPAREGAIERAAAALRAEARPA